MNREKKRIVAAGHICLDIMPEIEGDPVGSLTDLLTPGCLVETGKANVHIGGSVSNTGLGLHVLGADVSLMGKIGKDTFGSVVKDQVAEYVSTEYMIESEGASTSYTAVLAVPGIDRIFLHHPGANADFCADDIDYKAVEGAALFHFGYPPLMKKMYEDNGAQVVQMFEGAKSSGAATSLDTASIDENAASGAVDWDAFLRNVLPHTDFFVPSIEELAYMLDRDLYREWAARANGADVTTVIRLSEIQSLAEKLLSYGAKVVMIKCGLPGMYLATAGEEDLEGLKDILEPAAWANVRAFEKSFQAGTVLSATGAGDTSIAAFLYAVLQGYSWQECLQYAAATGACCVEAYDAISGLKSFAELRQRIDAGWAKTELEIH